MSLPTSRLVTYFAALCLASTSLPAKATAAQPAAEVPVVVGLPVKFDRGIPTVSGNVLTDDKYLFGGERSPRSSVLQTAEEAEKLYGKDGLAELQKRVDFAKQSVRIFKWIGSGGDQLTYEVSKTKPLEITFTRELGTRKDIRWHLHVYAIRKDVTTVSPVRTVAFPGFPDLVQEVEPAIAELKGVKVPPSAFKPQGFRKPIEIKSAEAAAEQLGKEAGAKLAKQVDFDEQVVLVFAWRGSGQDKLEYVVKETLPEQITFTRRPGRTRDLRPHVQVYALRSNVEWSTR